MTPRHRPATIAALAIVALAMWLGLERPTEAEIVGAQRTSWGLATPGTSGAVASFDSLGWAVEEVDGIVYAGGNFLDVTNGAQTRRQPYLAAFGTAGGAHVESFAPTVGGPVIALQAAPDGGLFVGGEMGDWNGATVGALAKIDPVTGAMWPGWNTRLYGGTSIVRDLSLGPDGWLYAAGSFTTASDAGTPQAVSSVVRMNPDTGAIDWSWVPVTGGGVWGVSASYVTSNVYLAGWNDVMAGNQVVGVDATDASQVTWNGFQMNFPCCDHMFDVQATPHGTVLAVGEQHGAYMYDETDGMALMISHATSYDSRHQASAVRAGGDYQDIEMVGDRLYASCHCWGSHSTLSGPSPIGYQGDLRYSDGTHTGLVSSVIAYRAQDGTRDLAFNPYMSGDIGGWGVLGASDGCLWIVGGINAVGQPGAQAPGRDLVRLCDENGPTPPPLKPGPASCVATIDGENVSVGWDPVDGALDYVIYRSVDGGTQSWRGRATTSPLLDTNRDAQLAYFVAARDLAEVKSERTPCMAEAVDQPNDPPAPPTNCTATILGDRVDVAWDAVEGAAEYVVYRSVDGGTQYWRGRTPTPMFTDTNRDGQLSYRVLATSAAGLRGDRADCQTADETPPPDPVEITPVASCAVTLVDGDDPSATVTWPPVAEVDALYVIHRTVDGGTRFWRGRTTDTTFADDLRSGDIAYDVEVKIGNERSIQTMCDPQITVP